MRKEGVATKTSTMIADSDESSDEEKKNKVENGVTSTAKTTKEELSSDEDDFKKPTAKGRIASSRPSTQ